MSLLISMYNSPMKHWSNSTILQILQSHLSKELNKVNEEIMKEQATAVNYFYILSYLSNMKFRKEACKLLIQELVNNMDSFKKNADVIG